MIESFKAISKTVAIVGIIGFLFNEVSLFVSLHIFGVSVLTPVPLHVKLDIKNYNRE